jgi:hypothetical protein
MTFPYNILYGPCQAIDQQSPIRPARDSPSARLRCCWPPAAAAAGSHFAATEESFATAAAARLCFRWQQPQPFQSRACRVLMRSENWGLWGPESCCCDYSLAFTPRSSTGAWAVKPNHPRRLLSGAKRQPATTLPHKPGALDEKESLRFALEIFTSRGEFVKFW